LKLDVKVPEELDRLAIPDREVGAPLKPAEERRRGRERRAIPDREVGAPLKLLVREVLVAVEVAIPDREVGAPLKHLQPPRAPAGERPSPTARSGLR